MVSQTEHFTDVHESLLAGRAKPNHLSSRNLIRKCELKEKSYKSNHA